ncbi:MAG: hypothetical protein ACK48S_02115 [Planctomycetia bacterium]|jgi:predicted nucleic acid-binding protein
MTVVSDASPLHYLVLIKAEHVLAQLFSETLLIDERDGTSIARRLGVTTVGTLGVLIFASAKNLLPLDQSFAALQETSFRVRPSLLAALLAHDKHRRSQGS